MASDSTHPASPSIFVSSTVKDLRDLRSAIYYTLREQGLNVYLSEASDFDVSGERTAIEECLKNVCACEYYLLVIGNKRGNLFDPGNSISITRQEYRVARDQFLSIGRPRLYFYLRKDTETALIRGDAVARSEGIDYPDHLRSFIDEVQNPPAQNAPNFLTRFDSFEDLIKSIKVNLNLGRNLSETLTRRALLSELAIEPPDYGTT